MLAQGLLGLCNTLACNERRLSFTGLRVQNLLYICPKNYVFNDPRRRKCVISLKLSVSKWNFEKKKKTWPVPKANKESSWNVMGKKQNRLCSLPIPGTQYYYAHKSLTKAYILKMKRRKVTWAIARFVRVYENFISKWRRETSHYCRPALACFLTGLKLRRWTRETARQQLPRRRGAPSLCRTPAGREENQLTQRGHFSLGLIKALTKTRLFFMLRVLTPPLPPHPKNNNNTSIILACECDMTLRSRTPCLQALKEAINQSWHYYLQLIVL